MTFDGPDQAVTVLQARIANTSKAPAGFVKRGENSEAAAAQSKVEILLNFPIKCRDVD